MIETLTRPSNGQKTREQKTTLQGSVAAALFNDIPGYGTPLPGTLRTYRLMENDPTIRLAQLAIEAPILAGKWQFEAKEDVSDDWQELIEDTFEPMRPRVIGEALRAIRHGFRPFEKVWDQVDGQFVVTNLKSLLPELTKIMVNEKTGVFTGIKQEKAELGPQKCWVYTHDQECDNYYGRPRYENVREAWFEGNELRKRAGQLATKASAIIPMVHYPMGTGQDGSATTNSNFTHAQAILNSLSTGRGICIPNLIANVDDIQGNAELAGKSMWMISFLEATGAATNLAGMTERERYLNTLKMRGMLVPERAATEAVIAGSRADSETGADLALLGCELLDRDIARSLNWYGGVNDMLAFNFGMEAMNQVYVCPAPLEDAKRAVFKKIFDAILGNPGTLEELLTQIDLDAVVDALEIPRSGKTITFSPLQPAEPQQSNVPPDQAVANADVYANAGAPDAGITTDMTLNGAQITAVVDVLLQLRQGMIQAMVAIELLVAVGIPRDKAIKMISATKAAPALPKEPVQDAAPVLPKTGA